MSESKLRSQSMDFAVFIINLDNSMGSENGHKKTVEAHGTVLPRDR